MTHNPLDVNLWKMSSDGIVMAQILILLERLEPHIIVSKSLNGAKFIQTVGKGSMYASCSLYVDSQEKLQEIDRLVAYGTIFKFQYREYIYQACIPDRLEWNAQVAGSIYTTDTDIQILTKERVK